MAPETAAVVHDAKVTVVLVHGLLRTSRSLARLARALEGAGFATRHFGYASTRGSIADHGRRLADSLATWTAELPGAPLHLVGHSLGNLVIRAALVDAPAQRIGRVVMLVPPNRGSPVARQLSRWFGGWIPVLHELSDRAGSAVHRLPAAPSIAIGVIAARFDHLVPETCTHLDGEHDHVRVPAFHTSVLWNRRVARLVIAFLRDGRFPAEA